MTTPPPDPPFATASSLQQRSGRSRPARGSLALVMARRARPRHLRTRTARRFRHSDPRRPSTSLRATAGKPAIPALAQRARSMGRLFLSIDRNHRLSAHDPRRRAREHASRARGRSSRCSRSPPDSCGSSRVSISNGPPSCSILPLAPRRRCCSPQSCGASRIGLPLRERSRSGHSSPPPSSASCPTRRRHTRRSRPASFSRCSRRARGWQPRCSSSPDSRGDTCCLSQQRRSAASSCTCANAGEAPARARGNRHRSASTVLATLRPSSRPFAWPVVAGLVTGRPDAYTATQHVWGYTADPWVTIDEWRHVITHFGTEPFPTVPTLALIAIVGVTAVSLTFRWPMALKVYAGVAAAFLVAIAQPMAIGYGSTPRFAFAILTLPIGLAFLSRWRALTIAMLAVSLLLQVPVGARPLERTARCRAVERGAPSSARTSTQTPDRIGRVPPIYCS